MLSLPTPTLLLMTLMLVVAAANKIPTITGKQIKEAREKCVKEVQESLKEDPMPKITSKTEHEWIYEKGTKGIERWKKYKPCLVGTHEAYKYCMEVKCTQESDSDGIKKDGKYSRCVVMCLYKKIVLTMFPETSRPQLMMTRRECMIKVQGDLEETPIEKFSIKAQNEWLSEKGIRWQKMKPCLTSKQPAFKYCFEDVCGNVGDQQNWIQNGPFDKCAKNCGRKAYLEDKA